MMYIIKWAAAEDFPNVFETYDEMIIWCKENCVGDFRGGRYTLADMSGEFDFELEDDAMAFKLRWI